jgi:hypothetical protein
MKYKITPKGLSSPSLTVGQVVHHLARIVAGKSTGTLSFRFYPNNFVSFSL